MLMSTGWWFQPFGTYEFVSWDDDIPDIWKVIKFHGSKPPTSRLVVFFFNCIQFFGTDHPISAQAREKNTQVRSDRSLLK